MASNTKTASNLLVAVLLVSGCGGGGTTGAEVSVELRDYQSLLAQFSETDPGSGPDVFAPGTTEQPETLAYVLKAEAIMGKATTRSNACVQRILARSDDDGDGIAGWGIDQEWDAFGDGTVNPRTQVYLVSNAIVLDGLLLALDQNILPSAQSDQMKRLVRDTASSSIAAFTESGAGGFFWYSTSSADAINVPNVNAYLAGVLQRAIRQHPTWFDANERSVLLNRVNRAIITLIAEARTEGDGLPYWAYVDQNFASPNDLVHHAYTIQGLMLYRNFGGEVALPWSDQVFADTFRMFLSGSQPTEYQQNLPALDPSLRSKPARVWAPGFAFDLLTAIGRSADAAPFLASLKNDYGVYPELRYTPLSSTPPPDGVFYPRIVAHCLPGLARRASGRSVQ